MHPSLIACFQHQVRSRPHAPALRQGDVQLSYGELNRRANRLARRLVRAGVTPGTRVGLVLGRCPEAVVAMLGILKAGAAYVPVDPDYPADWQAAILADSRPAILVGRAPACDAGEVPRLELEHEGSGGEDDPNPDIPPSPDALMYLMYTSGSSGRPKGVMVSHANVARLFPALAPHLRFHEGDVWTLFHSPSFGFSVWEIWGALAHGGCLVVVPPALTLASDKLLDFLARERVTVFSQTPTSFRLLVRALESRPAGWGLPDLRLVAFSGEPLDGHVLAPWLARFGADHPRLANLYALTETAGEITWHPVTRQDVDAGGRGVIGVPLADVHLHLLDEAGRPVAEGESGELFVGGPAVALGYFGRPELTAERFVADPFSPAGGRLYRTGDLARRRPDGEYEFIGRLDRQVKIRGYRVELGAVESALVRHPGVADAVVRPEADADGQTRLTAYVVPRRGQDLPADLRPYLAAILPHYAVPERFRALPSLPVTANGKLDEAALDALVGAREAESAAPVSCGCGCGDAGQGRKNTAEVLAALWRELLQVPEVGPEDDFFDLGGYSLLTLKLVMRLQEQLGVDISMTDVFEAPTLSRLARFIDTRRASGTAPVGLAGDAAADIRTADGLHLPFMRLAIEKAREAMAQGQPPYAACIVKDGEVVAAVHNVIWRNTDATAHAEVEAIREACRRLGTIDLSGCVIYSTAEPCSMCLTACVWANIDTIVYSVGMEDEARYGLSQPTVPSATMLQLMNRPQTLVPGFLRDEMRDVFEQWLRIQAVSP